MNFNSRKLFPILQRKGSVILENVSPDGEELPGTVGRLLIPGRTQTKISENSLCTSILSLQDFLCPVFLYKVSKGAKIRNRYNQVPHLTQDTNGKVTTSQ